MIELRIVPTSLEQLKALREINLAAFLDLPAGITAPQPQKAPAVPVGEEAWPEWLQPGEAPLWVAEKETSRYGVVEEFNFDLGLVAVRFSADGPPEEMAPNALRQATPEEITKAAGLRGGEQAKRRGRPPKDRETTIMPQAQAQAQAPLAAAAANPPAVQTAGEVKEGPRSKAKRVMQEYLDAGATTAELRALVKNYGETGTVSGVPDDKLPDLIAALEKATAAKLMD